MKRRQALVAVLICLVTGYTGRAQYLADTSLPASLSAAVEKTGFNYHTNKRCNNSAGTALPATGAIVIEKVPVLALPQQYVAKVSQKIRRFNKKLTRTTLRYLNNLISNEKQLQQKLATTDSAAAQELFSQSIDSLRKLRQQLIAGSEFTQSIDIPKDYNAYLDSLGESLAFLQGPGGYLNKGKAIAEKLSVNSNELLQLRNKLATTDAINQYVQERKDLLTGYFSSGKLTALNMPGLQALSKKMYFYRQQLTEWKEAFSQPGKLETKAMGLLRQLPLFKQFMLEHGALAGFNLFRRNETGYEC